MFPLRQEQEYLPMNRHIFVYLRVAGETAVARNTFARSALRFVNRLPQTQINAHMISRAVRLIRRQFQIMRSHLVFFLYDYLQYIFVIIVIIHQRRPIHVSLENRANENLRHLESGATDKRIGKPTFRVVDLNPVEI